MKKIFSFILVSLFFASISMAQKDSTNMQKAAVRYEQENYAEALVYVDKAVAAEPQHLTALFYSGYIRLILKDYSNSIKAFNSLVENSPTDKDAYLYRGVAKQKLLRFDDAQADFSLAIAQSPNFSDAYYERGYTYELSNKRDSACHYYNIAKEFGNRRATSKTERCDKNEGFDKHILRLTKRADNKNYGFSEKFPVKTGGSPSSQREYLDLLRDASGKPVKYSRAGSCCGYKLDSAPMGFAMLDKYEIIYSNEKGKTVKKIIYISFYEYDEPMIPDGFNADFISQ